MEVLGIDIGGTGIKAALVDIETGELVSERFRVPTPQPATPEAVINTVADVIKHFSWEGFVGCGFPAAIKNETVMTASNIDKSWIGLNAGKKIGKKIGCKTHLINDVDAAGVAEMHYGAGKGAKGTTIIVAVGTGIGTALFTDEHILVNSELGHIELNGIAAEKYVSKAVRKKTDMSWEEYGKRLNKYFNKLEFYFWPNLFIMGGGASKNFHKYSNQFDFKTKMVTAEMQNNAGIIGAAYSAYLEFNK